MPIKVTSRFATARDTARVLGVSKRRTDQLIEMADEWLDRRTPAPRDRSVTVYAKRKASNRSAAHTSRNGSASLSKTRAKAAKAKR